MDEAFKRLPKSIEEGDGSVIRRVCRGFVGFRYKSYVGCLEGNGEVPACEGSVV